jgi:predicted DNA-binding transcriptional regulator YafY
VPNPFKNTIKLLTAITLLSSPSGTTLRGLIHHLGISRRSAFRLLDALEKLGFPLVHEQSKPRNEKNYRLMDTYVLRLPNINVPNPDFTSEELEFILSVLKLYNTELEPEKIPIINSIRSKTTVKLPKGKKEKTMEGFYVRYI